MSVSLIARAPRRAPWMACVLLLSFVVGTNAVAGATSVITHGPGEQRHVALTFDDGWSAERCASITDTLRRKRAPATFFINGIYMARSPSRWRSILAGFPVANHGYGHVDLSRMSRSGIRAEVAGDEARIERILGRPMLKLLRPPFGAYDADVLSVASSLGYRLVLWDVDSGDTRAGATTSGIISQATRGGRGSIVLLHCGPSMTPAAVGWIIDSYRARGYVLVDLGRMLGLTPARPPRPATACRVRNARTGSRYWRTAPAVRAARAGDRLILSGTCQGSTTIRRDLTIVGRRIRGSGPPTLDGRRQGRVLTVMRGAFVRLRGLTIERGRDAEGGGIRNAGRLLLRDVVVRDNRGQYGAGIFNRPPGTLRLLGTTLIKGNRAGKEGGGLRDRGTTYGLRCGAGGNVRGNTPDDCFPAATPIPEPDPDPVPEPNP